MTTKDDVLIFNLTLKLINLTEEARDQIVFLNYGGCAIFTYKVLRRVMMLYPEIIRHMQIHMSGSIFDNNNKFISCSHMWFSIDGSHINGARYCTNKHELKEKHVEFVDSRNVGGFMSRIRVANSKLENWNPTYTRHRASYNRRLNRIIDKWLPPR